MRSKLYLVLLMTAGFACGSDSGSGQPDAKDGPTATGGKGGSTTVGTGGALAGTGGSAAGTGGATPGTGGGPGTGGRGGGSGGVLGPDGGDIDAGEPPYCAACEDATAARIFACPARRPAATSDLTPVCAAGLATGSPTAAVTFGDCSPLAPLPGCSASAADATVQVLSIDLGTRGVDCHYSRATGMLVGQVASADSPHYCGQRAYLAATPGVTNAWCRAGGANLLSVACTKSDQDGGSDDGPTIEVQMIDGTTDSPLRSACAACAADELCVAYYDGTCKPMHSTCKKVTAQTRQAILVDHATCFMNALGSEVCGGADGGTLWACGGPPCPQEPLAADVRCYGP